MEALYQQLLTLLSDIPELKWIDLNVGQLTEENPPVAFPCALIDIEMPQCTDIETTMQQVAGTFKITLAFKAYGETNNKTETTMRSNALAYFKTTNLVYRKLQGFGNENFYPFSRTAQNPENLRPGLKVVAMRFETSWHDYSAS